MIKTIFKKYT